MAARRLAGPAAASSRGADARPTRGRIREWGHPIPSHPIPSARQRCQRGFLPGAHPRPCPGAATPLGTRGCQRGCLGKPEVGMAKSHCKSHRRTAAAFCTCWGAETPTLQCRGCSCHVPVQQGGHVTLVPARLQQHPDSSNITHNGKLWLNPTSAAHPSPSVHGASRGIKG